MPNYDLELLITLHIGLTTMGFFGMLIGVWTITWHPTRVTREITAMTWKVAFMIRRQYRDIDQDV